MILTEKCSVAYACHSATVLTLLIIIVQHRFYFIVAVRTKSQELLLYVFVDSSLTDSELFRTFTYRTLSTYDVVSYQEYL